MQKFGICYPLHNLNNTYIVPSLLPVEPPSYDWNRAENLIFRYKYDFMPKGIVTRFIIAINDLIEQQSPSIPTSQLFWRNGVILTDNNARAEVIEFYNNKEIRIRIFGLQPRDLLAQIRREFKKIHDSYNDRLKYKELIPCNCPECKDSQSPHVYPLEVLHKSLQRENNRVQCQISFEMVNVQGLIDRISSKLAVNISQGDLRNLVESALNDNELSDLCFDYAQRIFDQFTTGQTKSQHIRLLVEHVIRQGKITELLSAIERLNPHKYAEFMRRDRT
jgi:C-terminal of Roc, COR, domain/Effector-associated domain 7